MTLELHRITWEVVAAVATLAAVVVALVPIWREARRQKAHARSLRIRLCSKLTLLRPSLGRVVQAGHAPYPAAILTNENFRETVRSLGTLMQESSVLQPEEHDQLSLVFPNLEMAAGLYDSPALTPDTARNALALIDQAVSVMGKCGLLHGPIETPWDSNAKEDRNHAG